MYLIYEGQAQSGDPNGFGRLLDGDWNQGFIGYFKRNEHANFYTWYTQAGKGIKFYDGNL